MKKTGRQLYEAPAAWAFQMEQECAICVSGNAVTEKFGTSSNNYGNEDFE